MCARYKASDPDNSPTARRGRAGARPQAAPRPRVRANHPAEEPPPQDPEDWEEDTAAGYAQPEPESQPRRVRSSRPRRVPMPARSPEPYGGDEADYPPDDAFGTPGPRREYRRRYQPADENPLNEFTRPPKKGMGCGGAILRVITLPFRMIGFVTRALPKLVLWPLRLAISAAFVGFVAVGFLALVYGMKSGRYDITQIERMPERSIVLDRKGNEIGTLHGENRRSITKLHEEVPQHFIDALILQEDRSFYEHGGISIRALGRAVMQVVKHHRTTQGGSTLTMQLAKNTYNHRERNFDAKFTEMALARRIEASYDKDAILLCYINRVFWGHTFLGLKQAAYGYFDKLPRDLTIGESAMLAGIVCSPNEFSPYRNPRYAQVQRDKVLKLMVDNGKITPAQYQAALKEPIATRRPEPLGTDNYALDLIRSEVDHILEMLDTSEQRIKSEAMVSGGLRVRTTLDVDLQTDVMKELDRRLVDMFEKAKKPVHQTRAQYRAALAAATPEQAARMQPKYIQAACVIIDNATGALIAVIGGRDSSESPLNRAVQSRRQVGSIFKPIVYSTFFDKGGSPESMLSDDAIQPGEIKGAKNWRPGNSDGKFTGMHPAGWGLLKSRNTMSVRAGNRAGLQSVVSSALLAGFPRPTRSPGPTIFLGTWEASPLEVAGAYTTFANGGVRPTPYIIESITDANGRVIWQNAPSARRVFSPQTTRATSAILQQITKPGGTAGSMQRLGFKHPCGGKTGTTNGYTNAWFCGFTSNLTAAVWVGFDRPVKIADRAYGGTVALPLWVGAMQCAAVRGYAMKDIRTSPAKGHTGGVRLCRVSGMLAHSGCEYEGKAYTETMADPNAKRSLCTIHEELAEDTAPDADEDVAEDPNDMFDIDDTAEEIDN
ncbi:MAG: transglycosylase domain-containing protein [Akkermansia sp.]|nr:transglycosylase domain-containing protein [Akkermansia sp.]